MKIFGVISLLYCIVPSCTEEFRFADNRDVVPTKIITRKRDDPMILDCTLEGYPSVYSIEWFLNEIVFCASSPSNTTCPLIFTEKNCPPLLDPLSERHLIECRLFIEGKIILRKRFLIFVKESLNPSTASDVPDYWVIAISSVFIAFFLIAMLIGYCVMREIERIEVRVGSGTSNQSENRTSMPLVRLDNSKISNKAKPSEDPAVASHSKKSKPTEDPAVAIPSKKSKPTEDPEDPAVGLTINEKIGEGRFVEVFKGYVNSSNEEGVQYLKPVTVQKLKMSVNVGYIREFIKRSETYFTFEHPNILACCGKCPLGPYEPTGIVTEFMDLGDLKSYLRSNRNELSSISKEPVLLSFAIQISAGMDYLTRKNFIHGDLGTRNCLLQYLGTELVVKIAESDMSGEENSGEYCQIGKSVEKFAVRWMSPESVLNKKFSIDPTSGHSVYCSDNCILSASSRILSILTNRYCN
ncbi:BDNF/NT-3 growth factors receptor-like [Planococcus citri]|uniref:BDNF/NT-3 growth factors receptor-like n=1 Tax=Planococcus citri TaxID=170843 RepID=UPI0031F90DC2